METATGKYIVELIIGPTSEKINVIMLLHYRTPESREYEYDIGEVFTAIVQC